jgi:hypothetical protein
MDIWIEGYEVKLVPSDNESTDSTVSGIYIEYYDFKIKNWASKILPELMQSNRSKFNSVGIDYIKYDSSVLNALYYRKYLGRSEIVFCYDDKAVYMRYDGKQNIEYLISVIEIWMINS